MTVTFVGATGLSAAGAASVGYVPACPGSTGDTLVYAILGSSGTVPQSDLFIGLTRQYADGLGFAVYTGVCDSMNYPSFKYSTAYFSLSMAAWSGATSVESASGATSLTAPAATSTTAGIAVRAYGGKFAAFSYSPNISPPSGVTSRLSTISAYTPYSEVDLADASAPAGVAVPAATATVAGGATVTNPASATIILSSNHPPNAPALNTPANSATLDMTTSNRFTWTPSDPDPGDVQTKFDLRYSSDSGATWTTITGTTSNPYVDVAGGTFAAGSYQWQVRTYDAAGVVGVYSASNFFTAAAPTGVPTITTPSGSVGVTPAAISWTVTTQTAYEVRTVADLAGAADPSTIYFDTGNVTDTTTRTVSAPFAPNGQYQHVQVRIQAGGLWSAWADARVLVAYLSPRPPLVIVNQVDVDPDTGLPCCAIEVIITNPAASSGYADAVSNDVYYAPPGEDLVRVAKGLPVDAYYLYRIPVGGDGSTVQVVAYAASGATAVSP